MRCPVTQTDLRTSETCYARLAWLEQYENNPKGVRNAALGSGNRERYDEYKLCKKCKRIPE